MDRETEEKIKQIGSMFGINEIPDNIGDIIESFVSNKDSSSNTEKKDKDTDNGLGIDEDTLKLISMLKNTFNKNKNDDKTRLLNALAPFLSEEKQVKVKNCVKLMTFAEIAKNKDILGL